MDLIKKMESSPPLHFSYEFLPCVYMAAAAELSKTRDFFKKNASSPKFREERNVVAPG